MSTNIELSLERDRLEGWEPFYDSLNVEVLRIARSCGHKFPPVDVVLEEGIYRLALGWGPREEWENYGGHSRSVLAFQDKYPLVCRVLPRHYINYKYYKDKPNHPLQDLRFIPISEIKPQRILTVDSLSRLNRNLNNLPAELRKIFLNQHDLVILENGLLIDGETFRNPPPF